LPDVLTEFLPVLGLVLISIAAGIAVMLGLDRTWGKPDPAPPLPALIDMQKPGLRFLFDGPDLVMASPDAQDVLATRPKELSAWDRVQDLTAHAFPELLDAMDALDEGTPVQLTAKDGYDMHTLRAERRLGLMYLSIDEDALAPQLVRVDQSTLASSQAELEELRGLLGDCPTPVWRETPDGVVVWANAAYRDLAQTLAPDHTAGWPYPRIFDSDSLELAGGVKRLSAGPPGAEHWFTCHKMPGNGVEARFYALPASEAVQAETTLQSFVATLTDTFSHLSTGLAVFDADRRLSLFNPALIELTGLDPAWASGRPTLGAVLDRLRELRMVPEPKDYKSWRDRIGSLEQEARQGNYREDWPLPDERTLRVTGRPHPRGALALMLEDITPQLSQTRRYRAELDLSSAVLDGLEEAVVVFSNVGTVLMANSAYAKLWGQDPNTTLEEVSIIDCTRIWSAECAPSPAWGDLRDFVGSPGERSEWSAAFARAGRGLLRARFQPLPGGGTLVAFREDTPELQHTREAQARTRAQTQAQARAG